MSKIERIAEKRCVREEDDSSDIEPPRKHKHIHCRPGVYGVVVVTNHREMRLQAYVLFKKPTDIQRHILGQIARHIEVPLGEPPTTFFDVVMSMSSKMRDQFLNGKTKIPASSLNRVEDLMFWEGDRPTVPTMLNALRTVFPKTTTDEALCELLLPHVFCENDFTMYDETMSSLELYNRDFHLCGYNL